MGDTTKLFKIPQSVLVVIHTPDLQVLLIERADAPGFWQSVTGAKDFADEAWRSEPVEKRLAHALVKGIDAFVELDTEEARAAYRAEVKAVGRPLRRRGTIFRRDFCSVATLSIITARFNGGVYCTRRGRSLPNRAQIQAMRHAAAGCMFLAYDRLRNRTSGLYRRNLSTQSDGLRPFSDPAPYPQACTCFHQA